MQARADHSHKLCAVVPRASPLAPDMSRGAERKERFLLVRISLRKRLSQERR